MSDVRGRRMLVNIATHVAARGVAMALLLATMAVLVRWRGEAETGLLFLAFNLQGFFVLAGLGLPGALVRALASAQGAGDWHRVGALAASATIFYAIVGAATATVLGLVAWLGMGAFALAPHEVEPARHLIAMTAAWALVWWPAQVLGQVLAGLRLFPQLGAATTVQSLVGQGALLLAALAEAPIEVLYAAFLSGHLVGFAMQATFVTVYARELHWRWSDARWSTLRPLMATSLWLLAFAMSGLVIQQTDVVLLAMFVSTGAVAIYTVLATPMMAVRELDGLVMGAALPSAAEAGSARDAAFLRRLALDGSRVHASIMLGLIAAAMGTAYPALHVWMGPTMADHAPLCRVLLATYAWVVGFNVLASILIGTGSLAGLGKYALASSLLNLGLSAALVVPLGLWGVVIGTVGTHALLAPWLVGLYRDVAPMPMGRYLARVLAPIHALGAAMAGVFWVLSWSLGPEPSPAMAVGVVVLAGVLCPTVMVAVCAPGAWALAMGRARG